MKPLYSLKPTLKHTAALSWERQFEAMPGIIRINEDNQAHFRALLARCEIADSYRTSPNYYFYTGRNGLWIFQAENAFVPVCRHPNLPDNILVFPQLGDCEPDLIAKLFSAMPMPVGDLQIARMRTGSLLEDYRHSLRYRDVIFEKQEEAVLDWRYPVHILSTSKIEELAGNRYMHIRNRIRQLKKCNVKVLPFDAIRHSRALENLLHRWATRNASNPVEYEELYAPYDSLFSWSMDAASGLSGIMIYVDDILQAIGLWDVSNNRQRTANLFVNFCNTGVAGLSEHLIVEACTALQRQGIDYLNLGGSETNGLDKFKRKFNPAFSLDLHSIAVTFRDVAMLGQMKQVPG